MKSRIVTVLKLLLAAVMYLLAVLFGIAANKDLQYTQVVLDRGISGIDAGRIQQQEWEEEEPVGFCFWGEKQEQLVTCLETGGAAVVMQICMAGNPELMETGILTFQKGCLVDEQTAQDLFGTTQVGSQVLWHNGKSYPVLGTVEAPRQTVVMMAAGDSEMNRLVLALSPEVGTVAGPQCLIRWGVSGTVLDSTFIWSLLHNLLLLFPGILVTMLCTYLASGWRKLTLDGILYGQQLKLWVKVILALTIALGMLLVLACQIVIPKAMIPTKWSDFGFWQRWWETEKENAVRLLFTPLGNGQLQILLNMVKSAVTNIAACVVLLWPVRRGRYADTSDRG